MQPNRKYITHRVPVLSPEVDCGRCFDCEKINKLAGREIM